LRQIAVDTGRTMPRPEAHLKVDQKIALASGLTLTSACDVLKLSRRQAAKLIGLGLGSFLLLRAQEVQAVTSRRSGLNEIVSTFGSAGFGRDYTSIGTWESATDNNNIAALQSPVLECYADAASYTTSVVISGATNDANYFRIIRAAAGQKHNGTPNTGFKISSTADDGFNIVETNSQLQDLIITVNVNIDDTITGIIMQGAGNKAIGCIVYDSVNSFSGRPARGILTTGANAIVVLCLVHNCEDFGIGVTGGNCFLYNCSIVDITGGSSRGIRVDTTAIVKNCLAMGTTSADYQTSGTVTGSSHNASEDATGDDFGATGARINQTFTFANSASNDFHLAAGDAGARTFGTNLSADANFAFDDDIDGQTILTWSMGFDSVGGTAATPLLKRYYQMSSQQQLQ
jgi:hypothetical protein